MDLKDLTYLELIELRSDINKAFEQFDQRTKTMVYCIEYCGESKYYINQENAEKKLNSLINDFNDLIWTEEGTSIGLKFIDEAALKLCEDYNK